MNRKPSIRAASSFALRAFGLGLGLVVVSVAACSSDESTNLCDEFSAPQILPSERPVCVDATEVNQSTSRPIQLQSRGSNALIIDENVVLEGNARGHFRFQTFMDGSTTRLGIDRTNVSCPEEAFVGIVYEPTAPGWDFATLVVQSNAQNFNPLRVFYLGLAVPADDPDFDPGPKPEEAEGACPMLP